ncbi:hypothetical protein ACOSQ4_026865 [Xanthoceras sorbifolium]
MATRNHTNAEFRNEVQEILGGHESSIYEEHTTMHTVLTELQALRISSNRSHSQPDINPLAPTESSQHVNLPSAKQYFDFKEVAVEQQVQLTSFHLEGIALQWHRWLTNLTDYEDPSKALTRLKQTSSVSVYQEEFEKLSHRVDELPEKFLISCFVAGLKDEIRLDVKIKQPRSLADPIGVARLVEKRNVCKEKGPAPIAPPF